MNTNQQNIILFDGVCNLCNRLVQFVIKQDKKDKFKFAALQSEAGQYFLKEFNLNVKDFDTFVYVKDNSFYIKSTASLNVMKQLGGLWQFLYVFIIIPKPIRDFFYTSVAKSRYKIFGKSESCMIPTPELKEKFLS